jgi:dipeptidase E
VSLVLTSDFPATANAAVLDRMRATSSRPRIAWIPPFTEAAAQYFPRAKGLFAVHGFPDLEYCDIDVAPDTRQLDHLDQYDIIYLTGGDPLRFRRNILRTGLADPLRQCLAAGVMVIGASGGALQLTRNVSLFRLVTDSVDQVLTEWAEYDALELVDYELLPHLNRLDDSFLAKVRCYSEGVDHDIIGLADGAAVLHTSDGGFRCVGEAVRFRGGTIMAMEMTT